MSRLPFNARRARGEGDPPKRPDDRPMPVSALAGLIDQALRDGLPARVSVEGEISGFRERTHWYFDLKDEQAVVSCVVFASTAAKLDRIADGDHVVARGRVEFYARAGRVSLIVTGIQRAGEGRHEAALRRLVEEIRTLGWLDAERKRRLPPFPTRVAVVTSRTGAALQDVLDTLRRRAPMIEVLVADARVQGDGAAAEITERIRDLSERAEELGVDAVILTRGGGSSEDLAAFNDRGVAQAVLECAVPVVAAIGHETDTSIAELVADVRAATPTQAAVLVSPDREAVGELLDAHRSRLAFALSRRLETAREQLNASRRRLDRVHPGRFLVAERQRLGERGHRIESAIGNALGGLGRQLDRMQLSLNRLRPDRRMAREHAGHAAALSRATARLESVLRARLTASQRRLASSARELHAVGPMEVLSRGYSVTLGPDGSVLRSVEDAPAGARLETRLPDGSVRSVVGGRPNLSRAPRARSAPPGQLDLFDRAE